MVLVLRILAAIVALVCATILPPWAGIWLWLAPMRDTLEAELDAVAEQVDGVILYLDIEGQEPALYAAGWRNRAAKVAADPDALFKIASISKLYIAAAAAKLVHRGQLSLDDTLASKMPGLAGRVEGAESITLRMLLQHRSGIPDYARAEGYNFWEPRDDDASLALVLDVPAEFDPGSGYSYSNTNYLLLGKILDKVLGYDHQRFIREEMLVPHGLNATFGSLTLAVAGEVASGYHRPDERDLRLLNYTNPGGSMVATAEDVGRFLRVLSAGALLSDGERQVYESVYPYEHTGWLPGYQSVARYREEIDTVIVVFVSSTGQDTEIVPRIVDDRIARWVGERRQ